MKVMQWNICKKDNKQSGIKRYEDELYDATSEIIDVSRIQRRGISYLRDINHYKENNSDIVHATVQTLAPLKIIKRPDNFVLTVHDIIPTLYYGKLRKLKSLWFLTERAIPSADMIITISEFSKTELIKYLKIDPDKIRVVPQGINSNYHNMDKDKCRNLFDLDTDPDTKYILVVSSNEEWKNMGLLNKIITKYKHPKHKFIKIGYGQILDHPDIINLGYISEEKMPYLYNACDLFIHPSTYEGFGLPPLEAMACGCPVISSNSASLPEVIGDAGILLDGYDVDSWVYQIDRVLSDSYLRNNLIKKGLNRSNKFSWHNTAQKTIEIYEEMLSSRY